MANKYENIVKDFNSKNCKLLTTNNELIEIIKISKKQNYKLKYIASCGHEHIVFYNVFKSRNTGIICPSCKNKETGKNIKEKMNNNVITKTYCVEQEFNFIKHLQKILENEFYIIKAFDGCNVDIIYKPKIIKENKWVGIQVKTTNKRHLTYSFHINNIYKNCLILLFCVENKNIWLIPENIIGNQQKISIGFNNSKYDIYKINEDMFIDKLNNLYNNTTNFEFEILNTPSNAYQKREKEFRKFRENIITYVNFTYNEMELTVFDFKINDLKIQEKVSKISDNNVCIFHLCKNNGTLNGKKKLKQYDIGDNDIYWLNCENKKQFLVIPEKILIEKKFIGNKDVKTILKITLKDELHHKSKWLQPYLFNYETINEELNKIRLCNLLA